MKLYKIILFALAAAMFGGCGLYSKYSRPAAAVEDVDGLYRGAAAEAADSTRNFGAAEWRTVFTDPFLQQLIDTALECNTDLQTARLRVGQAEASLKAARLGYVPSFGFSPNGAVSSFDNSRPQYTWSAPVTAAWQLDIFGRLTNAKRRAAAMVEGSEAYCQAVRTRVVASVANGYFTLLMLDAQLAVAEKTADIWRENVETMRLLKDAGMSNGAAVHQAEADYCSVRTTVHELREQIFVVENSLSALLCKPSYRIERGLLEEQVMPETFYTGVPLELLSCRPDVAYAEQTLAQAFYSVNEARGAFYPSITLNGSAGWTNSAGIIVNPAKLLLSAAASLFQPIFQNGALRAQLKISKSEMEAAELNFRQTLLNAANEVNNAVEQCRTARAKRLLYEQRTSSLEAAVADTRLLMQHGSSTYLEVLIAQQSLLNAQLGAIENRFGEIQGAVNLYQALGGGREILSDAGTPASDKRSRKNR